MKKIIAFLLNFVFLLGLCMPAHAAVIADAIIDPERSGTFYLSYMDTIEGTDPVVGAEFTLYKVAALTAEGGYKSLVDGVDAYSDDMDTPALLETVKQAYAAGGEGQKVYVTETGLNGQAEIRGIELGLYLVEESRPAEKHFATLPFFASFPYTENNQWWYEVLAEPKSLPAGDLMIKKTVRGKKADRRRDFHFVIDFVEEYNEPVHYTKSNGEEGIIFDGDAITLKHDEYAVIECLPVGMEYIVTEQEANKDGYNTVAKDEHGYIYRTLPITAEFTNIKRDVRTGDTYTYLIAGGIALVCLAGAIILIVVLNKKKKKQEPNQE